MKDNVLFVNRDEAEIKEFLSAMQDYTFDIDTADGGLEAAALLRKKQYKVVITGMNLSTYDGTKLIAYLNSRCPYTACIVYTTRVDLAQLRLLVNKRKVFRIFLKPVNYRGDFYSAIQDGFTYYDMREAEIEEPKNREKKKLLEDAGIGARGIERNQIAHFAYPMLQWSVHNFDLQLSGQEQMRVMLYEQKILSYYLKEDYSVCDSLEEVKNRICKEFCIEPEKQRIDIEITQHPVNPKPGFFEQLHFLMWLLADQIAGISDSYIIKIKLDCSIPFRPVLEVLGTVEREAWKQYRKKNTAKAVMMVAYNIVEAISGQCRREISENMVSYQIQMRTEGYKR